MLLNLSTSFSPGLSQASPGYNAINFYSSSSYVGDYVSTARGMGVLFGESSLPVAAYVTGVDLSLAANQRVRDAVGSKSVRYLNFAPYDNLEPNG